MYCSRCGMTLDAGVITCPRCGESLDRGGQQAPANYPSPVPPAHAAPGHADAAFDPYVSPKSRLVMLLLCIFVGVPGVHRFYAGRIITGIIWLCTFSLFGIGWLYDMVLIICGAFRDGDGRRIVRWE